jgi:dihydroflavonol-4-reductase
MKYLVIGGNSFVGQHLVMHLQNLGIDFSATYRSNIPTALSAVHWLHLDILDVDQLDAVVEQYSHVFLCANMVSFDDADADILMHNNVEGTANVVNACLVRSIQKLLYISSVAAIGRATMGDLINEQTTWLSTEKISVYAQSKYKAEMEVWRGQAEGLCTVIINPSIILGEGDWASSSAQLYKHAYSEFPYYTQGVNGFVDVKDVAAIMWALMQSTISNQKFIVNEDNHTYKHILGCIAKAMGRQEATKEAKPWMSAIMWRVYAFRKILTGKKALITKETAATAQASYKYDNSKLLHALPSFKYTTIEACITRSAAYYSEARPKA